MWAAVLIITESMRRWPKVTEIYRRLPKAGLIDKYQKPTKSQNVALQKLQKAYTKHLI